MVLRSVFSGFQRQLPMLKPPFALSCWLSCLLEVDSKVNPARTFYKCNWCEMNCISEYFVVFMTVVGFF